MAYWGLSEKGRQLWGFLERMFREGYSATEALETLREHGLGYRMTDFYKDWRIISGAVEKADRMKYVRRDYVISERLYTPGESRTGKRFVTTMKVKALDLITGETQDVYVKIGHDVPMIRADLEEMAKDITRRYNQLPLEAMPVGGIRNVRVL